MTEEDSQNVIRRLSVVPDLQSKKRPQSKTSHKSIMSQVIVDMTEILSYKESELRLIMVLSIFALACLSVSTAFVLIVTRLYGLYKDPKVVPFQEASQIFAPKDTEVLFVAQTGDIGSLNLDSAKFSKLQGLERLQNGKSAEIYVFQHGYSVNFVRVQQHKTIVRYDPRNQKHREVPGSKFPYYLHGYSFLP